jgi:hypothetical protein
MHDNHYRLWIKTSANDFWAQGCRACVRFLPRRWTSATIFSADMIILVPSNIIFEIGEPWSATAAMFRQQQLKRLRQSRAPARQDAKCFFPGGVLRNQVPDLVRPQSVVLSRAAAER